MTQIIELSLPFPPSINTYWGFHGHRRFLTKKANVFKQLVASAVKQHPPFGTQKLSISLDFYPPDRRIRDIDNPVKPLLDALVAAGLFEDDSQVKVLNLKMNDPIKYGLTKVKISVL